MRLFYGYRHTNHITSYPLTRSEAAIAFDRRRQAAMQLIAKRMAGEEVEYPFMRGCYLLRIDVMGCLFCQKDCLGRLYRIVDGVDSGSGTYVVVVAEREKHGNI